MPPKRKISIGIAILIIIGGGILLYFLFNQQPSDTSSATASALSEGATFVAPRPLQNVDGVNFEISSTTAEQDQGLGGRAVIPDNYAMLFVFPQDAQYGFWMKDMEAPLDMVWLTNNGTIASITPDVAVNSYPNVFYPPEPILYVLETRAGFAAEKGWKAGMKIALPVPY